MKISYKVPFIVTIAIVSAFSLLGTFQYSGMRKNITRQTESNVEEVAEVLSAQVTQWLNERLKIIAGMGVVIESNITIDEKNIPRNNNDITIDEKNIPRTNNDTLLIKKVLGNKVYATNASAYYLVFEKGDGKLISNQKIELPEDWDGRKQSWYQLASRNNLPMMTDPYINSEDERLLISSVIKMANGEEMLGVIAADIELNAIADAVKAVNFNNKGYAYLLDKSGVVISSPDQSMNGKDVNILYSGNKPKMNSVLQHSTMNGKPVLTSFYSLDDFKGSEKGWQLGIVIDENKVFASAEKFAQQEIVATAIAALLTSLISYLFMRTALIRPVKLLTKQSDEISRGKLDSEIDGVDRKDEIGELAQSVHRMQKALAIAMTKLADSRKK